MWQLLLKLLTQRTPRCPKRIQQPRTCAQCGRELQPEDRKFCDLCEAEILAQEIEFYD